MKPRTASVRILLKLEKAVPPRRWKHFRIYKAGKESEAKEAGKKRSRGQVVTPYRRRKKKKGSRKAESRGARAAQLQPKKPLTAAGNVDEEDQKQGLGH